MGAARQAKISVEEYLELDERSERGLDFHDGHVFAPVAATIEHAKLATRVARMLGNRLSKGCEAINNARVRVTTRQFVHPDVIVVCGKLQTVSAKDSSTINPKVIIEVLSPSTADYDRGGKFELYQQLATFEEYLLVSQDKPQVMVYRKQSGTRWTLEIIRGLDATALVESLGVDLPLAELYDGLF